MSQQFFITVAIKISFGFQVTIPLNPATLGSNIKVNLDDGRPKALQVETSEINIVSLSIGNLSGDTTFNSVLKSIKTGWLFSNANADNFPHETNVDGNVIPGFMEKLLSSGFHDFVLAPGDVPTCEEGCFTSWNLAVNCVCVNFIHEMSELGVTHNTKSFIPDFPLHMWLFENLSNKQAKSFLQPNDMFKPKFHCVVHIPSMISVTMNHLELLFLMRLGDSLNNFQLLMEEIFTFKSSGEHQMESTNDSNRTTGSHSLIKARQSRRITDVDFEFTGCILIKSLFFNAHLPPKIKKNAPTSAKVETEETPTQSKCKILLRAPTIDDTPLDYRLPPGVPYESNLMLTHNVVANITSPICVDPDPGLQDALRKSLPGTPRVMTPRSQSPTLSHSTSLSSMNIDDATNQFIGYQEDDFFVIDNHSKSVFDEKDNAVAELEGSTTSVSETATGGLSYKSQTSPTDHARQQPQEHLSQVPSELVSQNQIEVGEEMLPSDVESCKSYESNDKELIQDLQDSSITQIPTAGNSTLSQTHTLHQPTPTNQLNQVKIGEEMAPESSHMAYASNQQVQILNSDSAEVTPLHNPSFKQVNSATLSEDTVNDSDKGLSFSVPVVEEIQWQLQVSIFNICAIPIINPTGLIAKLSAGRIDLKEEPMMPLATPTETSAQEKAKLGNAQEEYDVYPSVQSRIELGPRIYKYYPTLEELHIPCVVQLYVNGVNASLLVSLMENLALMFEDEKKSSIPVPLYIILEGNQFLIMESLDAHVEDFRTLDISVDKVCIRRGPEVPKLAIWKTEHLGGEMAIAAYEDTSSVTELVSPSAGSNLIDSTKSEELDGLLTSIKTFTASVQPQMEKLGSLPQVQRINQILHELQGTVGLSEHSDPPPKYSESVDDGNATAAIASLQRDVESLQKEKQQLQDEVKSKQEQLQQKDTEMTQLVGELVKSKDNEVTMKEVVFRLNNQIQDVVMENDQLKVVMARAGLRVPVGKRL